MANYKVTDTDLISVADAIRLKGGTSESMVFPSGFVSAVQAIPSAASMSLISKTISENGTYLPSSDGADAFSQVVVDVAGGGGGLPAEVLTGGACSLYDNNVSAIRSWAFFRHSGVSSIDMNAVLSIGSSAFAYCDNLKSVSFPECTTIYDFAFTSCYKLKDINMQKLVTVGSQAFFSCSLITEINFPAVTAVNYFGLAGCSSISTVSLPECTLLNAGAFIGCKKLEDIYIPKAKRFGNSVFSGCVKLSSLSLPALENLSGSYIFSNCTLLTSLSLPVCSRVSSYAFTYSPIRTVTFDQYVYFDYNAFYYAGVLYSLYLLASSVCGMNAGGIFNGTPMSNSVSGVWGSIYVPASLVDSYKAANGWSAVQNRITAYDG